MSAALRYGAILVFAACEVVLHELTPYEPPAALIKRTAPDHSWQVRTEYDTRHETVREVLFDVVACGHHVPREVYVW